MMKTNCWLVLATLVATSAVAQTDTNSLPQIPAPATSAAPEVPVAAPAPEVAPAVEPAPAKKKAAPKKHVAKKISEPTVTLVPGPATVISENLNMRGQAGMKGEAIGHLKIGETVTVVSQINLDKHAADEPAQWAKILLPSETKVWLNTHYVDAATKTVKVKKLNLRAGPGENFSVVGVIENGASVNELSTKGDWAQIEAPANSFAFVAAMYLKQEAVVSAQPTVETPPVVPVPAPTPVNVAENQPVAAQPPVATGGAAAAAGMAPTTVDTNPPPPRVVSHEGYVRSPQSAARWRRRLTNLFDLGYGQCDQLP